MVRASALLDGITAPVESGFSNHERMNCISSSRRGTFFSTRTNDCDVGINLGSRGACGRLSRSVNGYRAPDRGSRWLAGMAAPIPQPCLLYTSDAADEEDSVDL